MANILVADDSKADRLVVARMLAEAEEYNVRFTENGEEALGAMQRRLPDIIVTDLFMSKVDGLELVSTVRNFDNEMMTPTSI